MKILLFCNTPIEKIAKNLNIRVSKPEPWLNGHVSLLQENHCEVSVAFPYSERTSGNVQGIFFYTYLENHSLEEQIKAIIQESRPQIIHLFGTEFPRTLTIVNACEQTAMLERTVISIQGLVSMIGKYHYYGFLPYCTIKGQTIRDFIKKDSMTLRQNAMVQCGKYEISAIQKAKNVIGRTDWDRACVLQMNPDIHYYFCNETLRDEFYKNAWSLEKCEKHSVFVSQSYHPLKGFHLMIEAFAQIVKKYPDAHLYATGVDFLSKRKWKEKIHFSYYQKYVISLVEKYHLYDKISLLGTLNEQQMCEQYLKTHVFVSPSSIENSPNSLGEAMILGVPSVASDVGGVKNMMDHGKDGYIYPADEPYMIAYYVSQIFENDEVALQFSKNASAHASVTHNREINAKQMLNIYQTIMKEKEI